MTDCSAATPHYQYVWSPVSADTPILRDTCVTTGGVTTTDPSQRIYYLTDANNNVTTLVNSSGSVIERYVYTPYGQVQVYHTFNWSDTPNSVSSVGNTILFGCMNLDPVTGLYHTQTRWYEPATGTFIMRDPAQADANLYRFCGDNPVNYVDPSGLQMSWSANELAAGDLAYGTGTVLFCR